MTKEKMISQTAADLKAHQDSCAKEWVNAKKRFDTIEDNVKEIRSTLWQNNRTMQRLIIGSTAILVLSLVVKEIVL